MDVCDRWRATNTTTTACRRVTTPPFMYSGLLVLTQALLTLLFILLLTGTVVNGQEQADQGGDSGVLSYHILEELPRGSIIGSVATDAKFSQKYRVEQQRKQLRFSFLQQPGVDTGLFNIQEVSGILSTARKIDRESLCPQEPHCVVYLDVAVGPAQFFKVLHTKIEILDINDNKPSFPQRPIQLEIPENALTGTGFSLPLAIDKDSDMNGVQKYELISSSKKFDLAEDITSGEVTDLKLVLTGELDREKKDSYQLKLIAHDGGNPAKSGSATINVTVLDANDNDPVFLNSTYVVSVPESQAINSTLVTLDAVDADAGENSRLTYMLNGRSKTNYGHIFGIHASRGALYLKGRLDYESEKLYNLVVSVRDGGSGSPHVAHCTVTVHVLDVNDNAPQVTVNTLTNSGEAEISELSSVGTFVAHISAIDRDDKRNGELSCALNSPLFRLDRLYRNQYKIVTSGVLDRETRAGYRLALRCTDRGSPPLSTTELIKVRVVDENDHVPVFSRESYDKTIEENAPKDLFLLRLNATDRDAGANARIEYTLADEGLKDLFSLDRDTGVLKTKVTFDHERTQKMNIQVIAADQGTPPLSASTMVTLTIRDKNDEKPQFSQNKYSCGVFENKAVGTEVGYVAATDADFEPFDRITYAFDSRDAAAGLFHIDPNTGLITTRQQLDREKQSAYNLRVLAYNPGYPDMTSTAPVTVHVADVNDNAPIIDHPEKGNASVSVSNRVPVRYVVYRVRAHDLDIASNAKLSYAIIGGNTGQLFAVDKTTGALRTTKDMSHIEKRTVVIRVQVRDGGDQPLTTSCFLYIHINSSIVYRHPNELVANPPRPANNMIIVIILSSASGIVLLILIIVLICIKLQTVQRRRHTYKCRPEAQRMLRSIDGKDEESPMSKIYLPPASATNVKCKAIGRRAQAEGSSTQNVHGCVQMEEGLQRMASEHYMSNMRYSRPPSRNGPPECPYTVHHNSKLSGMTSPLRHPAGDASCASDGVQMEGTYGVDRRPSKRPYPFQMCPTEDGGPKEAEMHQLLEVMGPADTESACSGDGSNPDSGRGPSEQGHQELDKVESDSHSEGHQRSSVSSTESAQPLPPPLVLANPPLGRSGAGGVGSGPSSGVMLGQPPQAAGGSSLCGGQYPLTVGRAQDIIRPHVYTELKTFSPGIHVRPPQTRAESRCASSSSTPNQPSSMAAVSCTASLPRYRIPNPSGTRTTTTFGREPSNGAQTVTTFGTPLPLGGDSSTKGEESCSTRGNGLENGSSSPEMASHENQSTSSLESRLHPSQRAQNMRISEPPKAPSIPETNSEDNSPQHQLLIEQQDRQLSCQNQSQRTPSSDAGMCNNVMTTTTSDIKRDVTDGDTSQDSGVVDPQELCQSIDDAFFKGMVIKHKTLV